MFGVIILLFCVRFTQGAPPSSSLCSISSSAILCVKPTIYPATMKKFIARQPERSNTLRRRYSKGGIMSKDQDPNYSHTERDGLPRVGASKNKNQPSIVKVVINLQFLHLAIAAILHAIAIAIACNMISKSPTEQVTNM